MRNNNNKRPRGRQQSNKRPVNPKFQTFDSNGPDGRVRGNAQQVYEKYISLAKDCTDDPVLAENYYQHAEHYYRILQAAVEWENQRREERGENAPRMRDGRNDRGNRPGRDDRSEGQPDENQTDDDGENVNGSDMDGDGDMDHGSDDGDMGADADMGHMDGDDHHDEVVVRPGRGRPARNDADGDGDAPAKRTTRGRRPATRSRTVAITTPGDDGERPADAIASDSVATSGDDADGAADGGEKKTRRASAAGGRTRGRHPTARRGRSRAAGREDGDDAGADDKPEPVSA